ncbi:hypothetical protein QA540_06775 [Macrococcus psychrotolerans]|uniref:Uncharacterized protein n=1 Tax=Macrococcus psychrotolerans TaxID=3039389 RepID=A0AAU6RDR2_9STAP|nr:hypothetical protein [Macrococcus sp. 19Msa1099]
MTKSSLIRYSLTTIKVASADVHHISHQPICLYKSTVCLLTFKVY